MLESHVCQEVKVLLGDTIDTAFCLPFKEFGAYSQKAVSKLGVAACLGSFGEETRDQQTEGESGTAAGRP